MKIGVDCLETSEMDAGRARLEGAHTKVAGACDSVNGPAWVFTCSLGAVVCLTLKTSLGTPRPPHKDGPDLACGGVEEVGIRN